MADRTYEWEKHNNLLILAYKVMILFNCGVWLYCVLVSEWLLALLTTLITYIAIKGHNSAKNHGQWILQTRTKAKTASLHWQAALLEYQTTGQLANWMFDESPSL